VGGWNGGWEIQMESERARKKSVVAVRDKFGGTAVVSAEPIAALDELPHPPISGEPAPTPPPHRARGSRFSSYSCPVPEPICSVLAELSSGDGVVQHSRELASLTPGRELGARTVRELQLSIV
jgi:hypothetical protein